MLESILLSSLEKIELPFYGVRCPNISFNEKLKNNKDANLDFLKSLCQKGFKNIKDKLIKEGANLDIYKERAISEVKILQELDFVDYILIVWDIIRFCHEKGIPTGPGRGSCGGSLILYLIGVTKIDPIKYNLYFERFISATRAKKNIVNGISYFDGSFLPDVDLDICYFRRNEVIKYLEERYPSKTAKILNVSTLSGKALIKDCGKVVLDKSEDEMNLVTSMIETKYGKVNQIEDEYKNKDDFRQWCDDNKKIYNTALKLKGLIRNKSVHASGQLISYDNINELCPTELTVDKERICSYNMDWSALINLKLDLLGLKSLSVIDDICKQLNIIYDDINIEDYDTIYAHLQDLKLPHGLFQIESHTNFDVCQKVKPKNLNQLSAVIALARPGALAFVDQYAKYANYGTIQEIHPIIDKILKDTGGVCIFQETMMKMAHEVFGLSLSEADILRKIVGKKLVKEIPGWKDIIYKKAEEKNLSIEIANLFWKILEDSSNYSFNFSHSAAYSKLSAITVYLKFNHPKEFFLALLKMANNESNFLEQSRIIAYEMKSFGIKLLPPHIVKSDFDFKIEGSDIRFGLSAIKGISTKTIQAIVKFRSDFQNKLECFDAAKNSKLNIGILSALLQAGALDGFAESRSRLVLEAQTYNLLTDKEKLLVHTLFDDKKSHDVLDAIKLLISTNDSNSKPYIKTSRFETIKKKYTAYKDIYLLNSKNEDLANFVYEYFLIGAPYSQKLHEIYKKKNPSFIALESLGTKKGSKCLFVGVVGEVVKTVSKSGNKYIRMEVLDESCKIICLLFDGQEGRIDKIKESNGDKLPVENDIVVIDGFIKDESTCYVNELGIQTNNICFKLKDLKNLEEKDDE